ncbi:16S rRNA (guanine(527)-N(7))-methyltransferase RsmG [Sedimentibacter sp. zth1]|uniref:16S rRNA (guanine(527)-N(7))-methyltransferase RsmG n=1 Tax=Sedimentibacter sp. zth1 TaxID=2816908 RepID=UPI001A93525D|nr:16S rRNA (guanine(527)-N(7))-methyltransferase RsmG [Sedimentibacter sp. zth1]QSX05187.1 16S rRNA (guanine(527)-N(7))-methyltransferase RsmG [Sedimentibacter sp. zth1]
MLIKTLQTGFNKLGLSYTDDIENKLIKYKELLLEWNQKINITRIQDEEEIYIKHYLDSIIILNSQNVNSTNRIIDVGTGGGFPGFPLKIVNNNIDLTLLDSLRKRTDFLQLVANTLKLDKVNVIHGRAEDFGHDKNYREKYDICVSRAVAPLNILCEFCLPFVKVGGFFAAYKSENIAEEIEASKNAIEKLCGKIKEIKQIKIPNSQIVRNIIIIEKINKLPNVYPRKAGTPAKKPL